MSKTMLSIMLFVGLIFVLSSCRPSDLEGAFVHLKNNRIDESLVLAEKVTKEYPENAEGWYLLGVLYGKKDKIADMVTAFDKSLSINQEFKTKIDAESNTYFASKFNSGASNYNAYIRMEDKTSDTAIKKMEESIQNFKDANTIQQDFRAQNLIATGYTLLGKNDEAFKTFTTMTENYPDSASTWISLGKFYFDSKDYDQAIKMFEKASDLDKNDSESVTLLAQCYDIKEMPEKAIPLYKKAIALNDKDSAIPFNLGLLLYKSAISKDVSPEDRKMNLEGAVEALSTSIDLNPDYQSSYQLKGNALLLLQRYAEAREVLEEGVQRFPEDGQMWSDLGVCYTQLNDKEKATNAFSKADALNK